MTVDFDGHQVRSIQIDDKRNMTPKLEKGNSEFWDSGHPSKSPSNTMA
jgi:hypothetical protein